jgi:hypothetical protein
LHKHGVIIQAPTVSTVVTLSTAVGITRNLHLRGVAVEYSHISDRRYIGFEARGGFNLAMPGKALPDCIYDRNAAPLEDELELEGVDTGRLQKMAQSFPVRVWEIVGKLV